jgi:branched-chain amino acid transport system ATP-binding protein
MATNPLLSVEDLTVRYQRGGVAVHRVSFSVAEGECVVIGGPNGAGKTSLVRGIGGFLGFEGVSVSGKVRIGDTDVLGRHPLSIVKLGVCLVPERKKVFSELSVDQNLAVLTAAAPHGDREHAFERAAELFPALADLRGRRAGLLSGGERQMLALAAALVRRPRLLILDEPCLGLAPVASKGLVTFLRRARETTGTTLLIVEQSVRTVRQLADRTLSMRSGSLVADASAAEESLRPLLRAVADERRES